LIEFLGGFNFMLAQLGAAQNVTQANTPQGAIYVHIINESY